MDPIADIYNQRGYLDVHSFDVLITFAIIFAVTMTTGYANYQSMLMAIRADWDIYRCNPAVMPFAGVVMPVEGKLGKDITLENFQYCVKKDTTIALSIAVMPIEFTMYAAIEFIDTLQEGVNQAMALTNWILDRINAEKEKIINMLKSFSVPIMELLTYLRDAIGKSSAIMTTALYIVMNMFNLIVSGTINVLKILSMIIITFTIIMSVMIVVALILIPTFFGAPVGFALWASAASLLASTIIPNLVIFTILRLFVTAINSVVAPPKSPPKPSMGKKKKKK
jgi:hypothetical protein